MKADGVTTETSSPEAAVKTVHYQKRGPGAPAGRVSVRTLREMIARWELGPDDLIRIEGDEEPRKVRDYPALSPLDEMLHDASGRVVEVRRGRGRRADAIRELEMLREYAEHNDRVYSVASFLLGWLRYAENPALSRGLYLKALERGYPFTSVARNNLAVAQIRLGDPSGRDNLILASNDPRRPAAALQNLARLLQHLESLGENVDEIANVKDLLRVARAEWRKAPPALGDPSSYALFLCEGDIPESFASEPRAAAKVQGQIEDVLAEAEDAVRQGRLEKAMANTARAASEMDKAREDLTAGPQRKGASPLRFLSVRLTRLEKEIQIARDARERQGLLDAFRKRLKSLEDSLRLKVPPADVIEQAELLLHAAQSDGEKTEAANILKECQAHVARHLLATAGELLAAGEKDVAAGLLRRALALETGASEEIRLRLASIRRDELEMEVAAAIEGHSFEEARVKIAQLRSTHSIFEPLAKRLETQVDAADAAALVELAAGACSAKPAGKDAVLEARRLLVRARSIHPDPGSLKPMEDHVEALAARLGLPPDAPRSPRAAGEENKESPAGSFVVDREKLDA